MIDIHRLQSTFKTARRDLLAEREETGHWVGQLSTSSLSTATAASALYLVAKNTKDRSRSNACRSLADSAIDWLAAHQNGDGGFGDTDKSFSNISTTYLVRAAVELSGRTDQFQDTIARADSYIEAEGGLAGLRRRYGKDKTFVVPIMTNLALAGLVPWKEVSALPFELASIPQRLYKMAKMPVVSCAIPALVAIGQARYFHRRPRNPVTWAVRHASVASSMRVLDKMQPASGGYLEAIPLTCFVVMSLASTGRSDHEIVERGLHFLWSTVGEDGCWPIDVNLATWTTSLSVSAVASATGTVGALKCLDWLLECQHHEVHDFTGAEPGGWGWTDQSGAVPDVDDTSAALLALIPLMNSVSDSKQPKIDQAVVMGLGWLLKLQNADGGWPTFCRGWGTLPFDRSAPDLTAHAIRAIFAWKNRADISREQREAAEKAIETGLAHLAKAQSADGSWTPLWFGNQSIESEENPVFGTARVLLVYRDLGLTESEEARKGFAYLRNVQREDGGWSGGEVSDARCSTEETAVAVEALLAMPCEKEGEVDAQVEAGLEWLFRATDNCQHRETAPIGLYFAKLWYYEKLYPQIFTVAALGRAIRRYMPAVPDETE